MPKRRFSQAAADPPRRKRYLALAVAAAITLTPAAGSILLTGFAPSVDQSLVPSASSIVVTGQAPIVAAGNTVAPSVGSVVVTGVAPSDAAGNTVAPGAGSILLTGEAPSVDQALAPAA